MGSQRFTKTARTGGASGALDSLDVTLDSLADGDKCTVTESGIVYEYWYDSDNAGAESSPTIIAPDNDNGVPYAGDGRWVLADLRIADVTVADITAASATIAALGLASGATVNEFSTDGTFAGNSDSAVPTEKAVKTLMDVRVSEYDSFIIDAASMIPIATSGAAVGSFEYPTNDVNLDYLAFDASTEEYAQFAIVLPESWDRSTVKAKFVWSPADSGGSSESETVEWEISALALGDNDAIDVAFGTSQVISDAVVAGTDGDLHISGATPAITVGGSPVLGDLIVFKISRNVSGTDDMVGDAWLFKVIIQFKNSYVVSGW